MPLFCVCEGVCVHVYKHIYLVYIQSLIYTQFIFDNLLGFQLIPYLKCNFFLKVVELFT